LGLLSASASPVAPSASSHRTTHASAAHAWNTKSTPLTLVHFVIFEENRIHHGVGALCRFDCCFKTLFTAMVNSIRKHNQSFASLLLFHQFVGGEVDCVIEQSASSEMAARPAPGTGIRVVWIASSRSAGALQFRSLQRIKRLF
jgi:hypothetical protein